MTASLEYQRAIQRRKARELLESCRDDPARFNAKVLGRSLWSKQIAVCEAVARSPITVVPAGRAVGKSYLMAGLVLWWLYTRPNSLVITTAPDHRQVASVLWKELRRAIRNSRRPLGYSSITRGLGSPQRLVIKEGTDWGALGFAAGYEEGFSGQHDGELLVIVDEASGIKEPIWRAIHGLKADRLVVAGNPIRYDCHFRELHDLAVEGKPGVATVPISALEHPDAGKERSGVGAVDAAFLRLMRQVWGDQSPWWRSNILGKFPGEESVRFIPLAWVDACTSETATQDRLWRDAPDGETWMGVDVGGGVGADRSVVVVRNSKQLLAVFASEWHGVLDDARERLEPVVLEMARRWKVPSERCFYDMAGIGRNFGAYLAREAAKRQETWRTHHPDQFHRDDVGPHPQGFDSATGYFGAGRGGLLYVNRRTRNAFRLKERLDPHRKGHVPFYCGGIAEWPALRQEIAAVHGPKMEFEDGHVKQCLEPKETLAARLKRSPDVLDALLMTFNYEV
jgi:hypothetical protein